MSAHAAPCASVNSGNWNNCATWSGLLCLLSCGGLIGAIPSASSQVTISNGDTVTVNISNAAANTLTTNSTGTLQFNSGTTLNVGNGVTNSGTTTVGAGTLNGASFTNNNIVSVSSGLVSVSGAYANTTTGDTITITGSGGRLTVGGTLTNGGTVTAGPGTVTSAAFTNDNLVSVSSGLINVTGNYTNTTSGDNITISTGTLTVGGTLNNGGTITFDNTGVINANGAFTSSGTVTNTAAGTINIKGATTVNGTFTPGSGTVTFVGTSGAQNVSGTALNFNNVTVNNASGISLTTTNQNLSASGTLLFSTGKITTLTDNKVSVTATGSVSGAGSTTGYVAGCLEKLFSGAGSFTFTIGDATVYAPVGVTTSGAGNLTWCTTAGDHPNIATSSLDPNFTVNRYWTATSNSVPTYSATFNFPFSEIDMGAVPANFLAQRYLATDVPPWSSPTMGTRTSTSTQVTGLSAIGAFAIGEQKPKVKNSFIYLRENY